MKKSLLLLSIIASISLHAGVSIKNGNFWMSYVDIVVPGGGDSLEIKRTFNSVSSHDGWFGYGWANKFETFLKTSADGAVVVNQGGAGSQMRFLPKTGADLKLAADKIIAAIKVKKQLSAAAEQTLREKMNNDASFRHTLATNFGVAATAKEGDIYYSNSVGAQTLVKTKDGWVRDLGVGTKQYFNQKGLLVKEVGSNGYTLDIVYDEKNLVKTIKDNFAKQLFFSWYSNGKVKEIWSAGDKKVLFKYDGALLSEAKNINGEVFKYAYDANFNMTKITYADGTSQIMKYDPQTLRIAEVVSRGGNSTKYDFSKDKLNPLHFATTVKKSGFGGEALVSKYEYELKKKTDGSTYTYRVITSIHGIDTDTTYSECCGLPTRIKRGSLVTDFEYNKKGMLTKKTSSKGEFVQIAYDERIDKITKVVNNEGWTTFAYDEKQNLTKAMNSQGQAVLLLYNREGKITKMIDQRMVSRAPASAPEKNVLDFTYNAIGKPVEISMEGIGKLNVSYDNYGKVTKVDSKSQPGLALKISKTFENLLNIVKPAGINLSI